MKMSAAALGLVLAVGARPASGQDRLVGLRALGGGVNVQAVQFGGDGLLQGSFGGQDSLRLRRAVQLNVPVTFATPLGGEWTLDVTSIYSAGTVTYDPADRRLPGGRTASLAGLSDVRIRASGRLVGDALLVTAGINAPTGQTQLDGEQLTAARVLAAPALGLGTPPVGAGASGTLGVLVARAVGQWAMAGGISYEMHDSYTPIGALIVGAPTTDYRPGSVVHASAGADGLVGRHRLSLSVAADVFGTDRLRAGIAGSTPGTVARVQLGPVLSTDAQLFLAAPRVREAVLWVSNRWRASFARDGATVSGSSGDYVDGGFRTSVPLSRWTDLLLAADGRWQSGLAFDDALITAGTTSGGITVGVPHRTGNLTIQPFARAQIGRVRTSDAVASAMTGGTVGLTILSRF